MSATILADLTSKDPRRITDGMWALVKLRDAAELDELAAALPVIERATQGVELGGIVHPNDATLAFALRKLAYHRDRVGCLCGLYPDLLLYDPEREAEAGNVRILGTRYVDDKWLDSYQCECTSCGSAFHVRYGEGHASWWEWARSD